MTQVLPQANTFAPPQSPCDSALGCIDESLERLAGQVNMLACGMANVLSAEPTCAETPPQPARTQQSSLHGRLLVIADLIDGLTSRVSDLRSRNTL